MDQIAFDLQAGIAAQRAGNIEQARACFLRILDVAPQHQEALLRLASVLPSPEHALLCVEQLLTINPDHERARELREVLLVRVLVAESAIDDAMEQPSSVEQRQRLGEMLVRTGVISYKQLDEALVTQARLAQQGKSFRLGTILLRLELIQPEQLEAALVAQIERLPALKRSDGPQRIGEYLIQQGIVNWAQVSEALRLQVELQRQGLRVRLGEVLVSCGYVERSRLHRTLLSWPTRYPLPLDRMGTGPR